jgi:hypothetical protein
VFRVKFLVALAELGLPLPADLPKKWVVDCKLYPKGLVISDAQLATVKIERNEFHGDWNYRIRSG